VTLAGDMTDDELKLSVAHVQNKVTCNSYCSHIW
jgi:hypothetical protein